MTDFSSDTATVEGGGAPAVTAAAPASHSERPRLKPLFVAPAGRGTGTNWTNWAKEVQLKHSVGQHLKLGATLGPTLMLTEVIFFQMEE